MPPDLADVVARAAARHPSPAAARSLETLRHWQDQVIARCRSTEAIPLPTLSGCPGPLRVGPDEIWCLRCGETLSAAGNCHRCGSQRGRRAAEVLRPDEYFIAN